MSEDSVSFTFYNNNKAITINEISEKIIQLYGGNDFKPSNLSKGKIKSDQYHLSFWDNDPDQVNRIEKVLIYLQKLTTHNVPYALISLDNTGDDFFFVLNQGHINQFECEDELHDYIKAIGEKSVEQLFYDNVNHKNTLLLTRIKFSKKKPLNALFSATHKYTQEPNEETYQQLKALIDQSKPYQGQVNFPFTNVGYADNERNLKNKKWLKKYNAIWFDPILDCRLGDMDLGRSLKFTHIDKYFIYLGFEFPDMFGIKPCKISDAYFGARSNIANGEGCQVLEMLECFELLEDVTRVQAKFSSPIWALSGYFYSGGDGLEYTPYWKSKERPITNW